KSLTCPLSFTNSAPCVRGFSPNCAVSPAIWELTPSLSCLPACSESRSNWSESWPADTASPRNGFQVARSKLVMDKLKLELSGAAAFLPQASVIGFPRLPFSNGFWGCAPPTVTACICADSLAVFTVTLHPNCKSSGGVDLPCWVTLKREALKRVLAAITEPPWVTDT